MIVVAVVTVLLLALRPDDQRYRAGERVEGITESLTRDLPEDFPGVVFQDVTLEAGLAMPHFPGRRSTQLPEDMGSGAAWGDYNGDGHLDLYVCDIAGPLTWSPDQMQHSSGGNKLFRNRGDGTFDEVAEEAGVAFRGISMGAAWGDYDGDGDLDLLVTNYGSIVLYENQGDGTFLDASEKAGLNDLEGFWTGVSWADYDLDGDLDLYVCGYVEYRYNADDHGKATSQYEATVPYTLNPSSYPPQSNLLLRNDGGRFTDVAAALGVDNPKGRSLSAAWCDLDEDGWPDLYVANDISDNALYRNLEGKLFEDVSTYAWVADYRGAMGLALGDWDNDRDIDIFVTHWIAQENALYDNTLRMIAGVEPDEPNLQFFDVADQVGLGQIALPNIGWGTSFVDIDNDGLLDLWVVNGSTFQQKDNPEKLVPMKTQLFWNRGREDGFFEVGKALGDTFTRALVGRGAAFADYDNDGDMDAFLIAYGEVPRLLRNDGGNRNNWLKIRVFESDHSHSSAGTRIDLYLAEQSQTRVLGSQPSYLSQNAPEALFGLGNARRVDRIEVRFPCGEVVVRENLAVNQALTIHRGIE